MEYAEVNKISRLGECVGDTFRAVSRAQVPNIRTQGVIGADILRIAVPAMVLLALLVHSDARASHYEVSHDSAVKSAVDYYCFTPGGVLEIAALLYLNNIL